MPLDLQEIADQLRAENSPLPDGIEIEVDREFDRILIMIMINSSPSPWRTDGFFISRRSIDDNLHPYRASLAIKTLGEMITVAKPQPFLRPA